MLCNYANFVCFFVRFMLNSDLSTLYMNHTHFISSFADCCCCCYFLYAFLNEGTEHKATIQCITMNTLFYVCVNSNATRIVVHELDANHTEYQSHSFVLRSRCFHKPSSDLYECKGKNERAMKFILKWSKQYFPCNGTLKPNSSPVMQLYRVRKRNKQNSEKKRIYHK